MRLLIKNYIFQGITYTQSLLSYFYDKFQQKIQLDANDTQESIPSTENKLLVDKNQFNHTVPYFLEQREHGVIDPEWQYYLKLYWQIKELNTDEELNFSAENAPLFQLQLSVTNKGLLEITSPQALPIHYTRFEAYQIAKAIYQLAYSYTSNPYNDKTLALKKAIGFFLMRPFAKLYPTKEVLAILNLYRELEFTYTRRIIYRENYPTIESTEQHSAITIQRLFRKHQQTKRIIEIEHISEALKNSMLFHQISLHPQAPLAFSPPSKEQKEKWLSKQAVNQDLHTKVLNNLVYYRSHAKFKKRLLSCVRDFNTLLFSLPHDLHDYAILIPVGGAKSNHWVSALALTNLEKKPKVILNPHEVKEYKRHNPTIKHFVIFDDAIYSGRQLMALISKAKISGAIYTLVVPFYNQIGLVRASNADNYILGERMLRAEEFESCYPSVNTWRRKDSQLLDKTFSSEWNPASSKVGVFFQHKTADSASTFLSNINTIIPTINNKHIYS